MVFTKTQCLTWTKEVTVINVLGKYKRYHTNLLMKCRTTLYCPEYYIDEIKQTKVVRHILITHRNLIGFKLNRRDKIPSFNVCSVEVLLKECCQLALLLVAVCWCRGNKYKPSKWTFFQILHQNRVKKKFNVMITTFENRCLLKIYIIVMRPIFNTTHKGKKQVKVYMWALHHELVLFQQSRNCFCYVPENETEGDILGCTTSIV